MHNIAQGYNAQPCTTMHNNAQPTIRNHQHACAGSVLAPGGEVDYAFSKIDLQTVHFADHVTPKVLFFFSSFLFSFFLFLPLLFFSYSSLILLLFFSYSSFFFLFFS